MLYLQAPIGPLIDTVHSWNPARNAAGQLIQYIDLSSIDSVTKSIITNAPIRADDAPSRARQLVRRGDVLVSTVRPNLNGVARITSDLDGATASTGFCVLRPKLDVLDSGYLFHWVKTPAFVTHLTRRATGASYPAVTDRIIFESTIPVPPIDEQRRIAAILDQADDLRRKRRLALIKLNELPQAIFQEMFGDPVTNPKKWPRLPLRDLLGDIQGGWSPVCLDRPASVSEWGVLKLSAVTACVYDDAEQKALPSGTKPRIALEVMSGDILFSRKNTHLLVGACAYVHTTRPKLTFPDLIFRLRPRRKDAAVLGRYLHSLLVTPTKRRQIQLLASGVAGSMPNISMGRLSAVDIEVPPMSLQLRFAGILESIESTRQSYCSHLATLDQLFASLQDRAFAGTLTQESPIEATLASV